MADRYDRGEVVHIYYYNYVYGTDTLVDCDTGYPEFSLWNPDGTLKVNAAQMTWELEGTYYYTYLFPADAEQDWWPTMFKVVTDGLVTISYDGCEVI